jgi:hypothetical protein
MLLIAYTPRADSDERGYDDWLRDVDMPFFNSVEGIAHYSNWKITSSPVGACNFTHFDLVFIDPNANPAEVFGSPAVAEFASGWNDLWGTHPEGTFADSGVEVLRCRLIARPDKVEWRSHLALITTTPRADAHSRGYDDWLRAVDNPFLNSIEAIVSYTNWRVDEAEFGEVRFTDFDLMAVDGADGWDQMVGDEAMRDFALGWIKEWGAAPDGEMDENFQVNVAEVIATPGI